MKIYIAGPITKFLGQGANKAAFLDAAEEIEGLGHTPVVPHDLIEHLDLHPIDDYKEIMAICLKELMSCDRVAMLPNWRDSKGATQECVFATQIGKPVDEIIETIKYLRTLQAA